ncbi:MAG: NAD(P)-dependent oxidoreductase, partial [Phycisphaerales bacterium]|nr:NAD(P)-dependent oxidoreductase [Phycisphaerales bacterium]
MSEARATDPILVTGAGGFVGRHLLAHAAAEGRTLLAATRDPNRLAAPRSVETVAIGPLDEVSTWRELVRRCGGIVHLAAHAHRVGRDREEAEAFQRVNVEGTRALAEAVRESERPLRVVLMSSIGAIGDRSDPDRPLTDESTPAPRSNYGRSKLDA